jgi:sugar lactone lactonase YvrE
MTNACHPKPLIRSVALRTASCVGALLIAGVPGAARADKAADRADPKPSPEASKIFSKSTRLAKDLRGPDGLALDLKSGDLYVSEENAAAIVRIKPNGSRQVVIDGTTPVFEEQGRSRKKTIGLRSPEGIAFAAPRTLYVAEDVPGGRLIAFEFGDKSGPSSAAGTVVPLPLPNHRFAWESIDLGPAGELLLAGSTLEAFGSDPDAGGLLGLVRGAILYRDAQGEWWLPLNDALASYSAARFSPDGQFAFFADELSGDVGCLDLRTRNVRTFRSVKRFRAPEGLWALPGGAVLVAEEGGAIYRLDPTTDTLQLLYENAGTVESVLWDERNHRLLAADDQHGTILALEMKAGLGLRAAIGTILDIRFEDQSTPVEMIPERCPGYLAKVLKLGGFDPNREGSKVTFQDFARKYCMVAIDANAELIAPDPAIADPIEHIQFVIVAPYLIGVKEGELIWSSSGFTAVKASGQKLKTELVQRQVVHGDLMETRFTPVGGQTIALPMPFSARINSDGFVTVHFMGMGAMPDFLLELNTVDPSQSIMVVMPLEGPTEQYRISLPSRRNRNHWVIALERKAPDVWRRLSLPARWTGKGVSGGARNK